LRHYKRTLCEWNLSLSLSGSFVGGTRRESYYNGDSESYITKGSGNEASLL
jgi:hypothetical protein